ncbi:MAG: hypothetical protein RLZZ28_1561 [Bacteroidota bacterium]
MKIHTYLLTALLLTTVLAYSQDPGAAPPNIIGLKMAFITKQLELTNEESQKFWPVYYTYSAELRKSRQSKKEDILAQEEEMLNIRKKYRNEFKKILVSEERVNKALTVDRDFMNVVRKELQQRARNGKGRQKEFN